MTTGPLSRNLCKPLLYTIQYCRRDAQQIPACGFNAAKPWCILGFHRGSCMEELVVHEGMKFELGDAVLSQEPNLHRLQKTNLPRAKALWGPGKQRQWTDKARWKQESMIRSGSGTHDWSRGPRNAISFGFAKSCIFAINIPLHQIQCIPF